MWSSSGGLPNTATVRKVTRFARILSFLLFATKDPCLGLPGGIYKKIKRKPWNTLGGVSGVWERKQRVRELFIF